MTNLGRDDVERIVENVLENLSITVPDGGFTDPNSRQIILSYNGREISSAYFDVNSRDEYQG